MLEYPSVVSRTLDPAGKSLLTVVALHDHEISDADVNLIQDLQGYKRHQVLKDGPATSGCLTWSPLAFSTSVPNTFTVPSFDVLFSGEEVTVTGYLSADQALNQVVLPPPAPWPSSDEPARVYVVFLELWYQALDPTTGAGYYSVTDPVTGAISNFFWPYGCINPDPSLYESMPDDSVDIFGSLTAGGGLYTTQRAQIQWSMNVQRVGLSYDFTRYRYGLDPVGTGPLQAVYSQAAQPSPITLDATYQFQNLGPVTGDTGLWRAGNGSPTNSLGTLDGYSYAMPVAVVFQRNSGIFSLGSNIFGCASAGTSDSGTLATGISGRFDLRLADQVFPDDTVDTRQSVSLDGWDYEKLSGEGFTDIITGSLRSAIGRGKPPGMSPYDLGSALDYYVSVASAIIPNTNTVGAFDGFMNGFSSDQRTFYVTKQVSIYGTPSTPQNPDGTSGTIGKSVGTAGASWSQNDAFTICLPSASTTVSASATITSAFVQGLNTPVGGGAKVPVSLLSGAQVLVQGLNSRTIVVSFPQNLYGTLYDPGASNIYVTLGITYPAGGSASLVNIPAAVDGGSLYDGITGKALPVSGVSEYAIQAQQIAPLAYQVWSYNPEYSSVQFGTRVWVRVAGSSGVQQTVAGGVTTTFVVPTQGISGQVNGLYVVGAWDLATGSPYAIASRTISGTNCIVTIQAPVASASTVVMSFMAQDTAQIAYNPSVMGVTQIEETVLFGTYAHTPSSPANSPSLWTDSRVVVESVSYDSASGASTVVLAGNRCTIKGISGNDIGRLVWVQDQLGNLNAVPVSTASFSNGYAIVVVPGTNLDQAQGGSAFLFVGSILPALSPSSVLTVEERYVPYQGEGVEGHTYEVLYASDNALITTNGTGTAPVIGLADVFPYNRQVPISTTLPSQVGWPDATLANTPLATLFDSNYVAMRQGNVETVFEAPLHTNDFILPVNRDIRKQIQLLQGGSGGRGFAKALPHVGFAIEPPVPRTVLGQNLQSTTAPIVLYVNNVGGNDSNNGLTPQAAKLTITGAVNALPPVLRHPCSIQLVTTGVPYTIANISSSLQIIALGDGTIRTAKWYALANLAFSIQEEGRVVITSTANATLPITIDATTWTGFGDGPTSAFFVNNSRVLFNNILFQGFVNPAVYGIDSDIEFVGCFFNNNAQAGGFEQGSGVIMTGGSMSLPMGGTGFVLSQSELTVSGALLAVATGATPGAFFTAERSSCVNLSQHQASQETGVLPTTVIAYAQLNSSIVADSTFQSAGEAVLTALSVLARSPTIDPFLGGIQADATSSVVVQI